MSPITIMEDFPIGTVVKRRCDQYTDFNVREDKVERYIFDGQCWYPAYDTWDGWYPYCGDDGDEIYHPDTNEESQAVEDWLTAINESEK
jgi:hypothetical protein